MNKDDLANESFKKKFLVQFGRLHTSFAIARRAGGVELVSISPTFYEQLLHQNPFAKKLQTQIVST
jgi:hypothetical protein